jgi:hypothetical protein
MTANVEIRAAQLIRRTATATPDESRISATHEEEEDNHPSVFYI